MIIWGGFDGVRLNTGSRYDPLTDSWMPIAAPGTLPARSEHAAVWSGSRMIVWAGRGWPDSTGNRYNPITNTWQTTSTVNAPVGRNGATAVWTGSEMIVWGGESIPTGGRYNPVTNSWTATSDTDAPTGRSGHSAVWTGTEMIIFGGVDVSLAFDTGGRYSPATNTWTPTSTLGAPSPRYDHTATWTGSEMIVWAGRNGLVFNPDGGGRYDPVTDTWTTIVADSVVRASHTAVWNGWAVVVWGGLTATGGFYDPNSDTWVTTSMVDAPSLRRSHTAVWADRQMIVWGGHDGTRAVSSGGILSVTRGPDDDGDGVSACEGDCDNTQATVYPGAPQTCDGLNNDCSDVAWPVVPAGERDDDLDGYWSCGPDCDDAHPSVYPGAPQICGDGLNNDCADPTWPDPGEDDEDLDGIRGCEGDCDDTRITVFPDAPPVCDGVNNDCNDWRWPQLYVDERDADQDGFGICAGDCDDFRAATRPGAPETNDGLDNQCPSDLGHGVIDELSGPLTWVPGGSSQDLCWATQPGATLYAVARSGTPSLGGTCRVSTTVGTCWSETETPAPDQMFFYLIRPLSPNTGSWGQDSSGAARANICAQSASVYEFSFIDSPGDDIPTTSLRDFFASVPNSPSSHLLVAIEGSPGSGAYCTERADFHRNNYLASGGTTGNQQSGSWNKWFRSQSSPWSGPITTAFSNSYGTSCAQTWSWCPDFGLGNLFHRILPAVTSTCEIVEGSSPVCSNGTWRMTIRISEDRMTACGF